MTVENVLKFSLKDLKREDLLSTTYFNQQGVVPTAEQTEVVNDLIDSLNDVILGVAYIYYPLKTFEIINVTNEQFEYKDLSKTLIDVIRLKDSLGVSHNFTTFPSFIKCKNGRYTLTYTYQPSLVQNLSDEIDLSENKITEKLLSIGCTANFYLKRGMYEDSNYWQSYFEKMILLAKNPKYVVDLPCRGWE